MDTGTTARRAPISCRSARQLDRALDDCHQRRQRDGRDGDDQRAGADGALHPHQPDRVDAARRLAIQELNVSGPALSRPGWVATASVTGGTDVAANAIDGAGDDAMDHGRRAGQRPELHVDMGAIQVFNQLTLDAGNEHREVPAQLFGVGVEQRGQLDSPVTTGTGTPAGHHQLRDPDGALLPRSR